MSRNTNLPFFPLPPTEYSTEYLSRLIQAFTVYLTRMQNAGEGRHTELVLTSLQTDDSGLELGGLFQQAGFVKVTLINTPHVRGSSATGSVGTTTVTIT